MVDISLAKVATVLMSMGMCCGMMMVEHLVEEIGWEMAGRLKVYYCIPILSLQKNG